MSRKKGFTIVELLIVVVVIAILAAVTVAAYNGIQQQAVNAKTTQALQSWVKALNMYKTEQGQWPTGWVCLGEGYPYGESGVEATGTAQCRMTGSSGYTVELSFNTKMRPYTGGGGMPTPSFVTASITNEWRRGIFYAYGGGGSGTEVYLQAVFKGNVSCPPVAGTTTKGLWGSNTMCSYFIGSITDK